MTEAASRKSMTEGELLVLLGFSALALLALVGAAKAEDAAFAFHCFLTAAASVAVVFGTFNHYFDRPADPPPREIDGRPNYNFAPIKAAAVLAAFWGIVWFLVGLWAALELAWPALNFDLPWFN